MQQQDAYCLCMRQEEKISGDSLLHVTIWPSKLIFSMYVYVVADDVIIIMHRFGLNDAH